jgi:hypothetical protein
MIGKMVELDWIAFGHGRRADVWAWNENDPAPTLFNAGGHEEAGCEHYHLVGRTDYDLKVVTVREGLHHSDKSNVQSDLKAKRVARRIDRIQKVFAASHEEFKIYFFPWGDRGCLIS